MLFSLLPKTDMWSVDGWGWFKQPHLARVRLIGLWGWVRLHTCWTFCNWCARVKPAITRTLTLTGISYMAVWIIIWFRQYTTTIIKRLSKVFHTHIHTRHTHTRDAQEWCTSFLFHCSKALFLCTIYFTTCGEWRFAWETLCHHRVLKWAHSNVVVKIVDIVVKCDSWDSPMVLIPICTWHCCCCCGTWIFLLGLIMVDFILSLSKSAGMVK